MMNEENNKGVMPELPEFFDLSHGSTNTYMIEARHRVIPPCIHCHQFRPILVDGTEWYFYFVKGQFDTVKQGFPHNTAPEHELLMTGIHPACWEAIFADSEKI